ncbi:hypothetical protein MSG28_011453 [Choristoneura fumiferana]|uniref:Uncharacterized protein n=2 Tax=Choristoneura fumiferana TaxID=7141 RepID=A0ACC0JNH2_CHOFU|nr:hypothetical protein MSG28_011451 [Choristoneura fumiferana]KAI8425639.1 hypothetical protein MSG28_011453 [Choristoneura fumiferana]
MASRSLAGCRPYKPNTRTIQAPGTISKGVPKPIDAEYALADQKTPYIRNKTEAWDKIQLSSRPASSCFADEKDFTSRRRVRPLRPSSDAIATSTTAAILKPQGGSRQVSQFSRYSDVMLPPSRRTFYHPYLDYAAPELLPYAF